MSKASEWEKIARKRPSEFKIEHKVSAEVGIYGELVVGACSPADHVWSYNGIGVTDALRLAAWIKENFE